MEPAKDGARPMYEEIRGPVTSHEGIAEHFIRVCTFLDLAAKLPEVERKFRLLVAAVYSCRAIAELMFEHADDGELVADRNGIKGMLAHFVPYFNLVERLRVQDFHRHALTPPIP